MTNATYRAGIIGLGFIGGRIKSPEMPSVSRSAVLTAHTSTPYPIIPALI